MVRKKRIKLTCKCLFSSESNIHQMSSRKVTKPPAKSGVVNRKPRRPVGHIEDVHQMGERVVIDENERFFWPSRQYRIFEHWFPETTNHRQELRWSRRRRPIQPIVWEGAYGYQAPPRPPPPPPAPASA